MGTYLLMRDVLILCSSVGDLRRKYYFEYRSTYIVQSTIVRLTKLSVVVLNSLGQRAMIVMYGC